MFYSIMRSYEVGRCEEADGDHALDDNKEMKRNTNEVTRFYIKMVQV